MKKNPIILIILATILGLVTSCATDELVSPNPEGTTPSPGQQITITAKLGDANSANTPGTRMGYTPDEAGTGLKTTWTVGDAFNIVPQSSSGGDHSMKDYAQTFTLTSVDPSTGIGTFTGTAPTVGSNVSVNGKYSICYPAQYNLPWGGQPTIKCYSDFLDFLYFSPSKTIVQTQIGNDNTDHLTGRHSMCLKGIADYTTIDFSPEADNESLYKSSCMKFVLTLPESVIPEKITIAVNKKEEINKTFCYTNSTLNETSFLSLALSGFTEPTNQITAYMMMSAFPVTLPEEGIIVTVDTEDKRQYTQIIPTPKVDGNPVVLEGGKMHTIIASQMKRNLASMKFTIRVGVKDLDGNVLKRFVIPFSTSGTTPAGIDITVDWGDGSKTDVPGGTTLKDPDDDPNNLLIHEYAEEKDYQITITSTQMDATKQQIPNFRFVPETGTSDPFSRSATMLISMDSPMLNKGAADFSMTFMGCSNLASIPKDLFEKNAQATNFFYCFYYTGLTTIPAKLFEKNTLATNFNHCFSDCKKLTTTGYPFSGSNSKAENFGSCFYNCTNLTRVSQGLFSNLASATNFESCFRNCGKLILNAHIFGTNSDGSTDTSRFQHKDNMNFQDCFKDVGSELTKEQIEAERNPEGWAPGLQYFKMGTGKNWITKNCFTGCRAYNFKHDPPDTSWGTPMSWDTPGTY